MVSRRQIVVAGLALPLVQGRALAQTPACGKQTARQTAGPFFKPDSPKRNSLREKDDRKDLLTVSGVVLGVDCKPVANVLLDFWHADEFGEYDNRNFRYRGHQFTNGEGRWRLDTILPAEYPGRARHIHVNVQAPGKRVLTTQLYFPASFGHHSDGLYRSDLEMKMSGTDAGRFDFVVDA
jgi:protocatechuate 3,4-dioxygenase beta subunit